ncbi:hypothetical protein A3B57_00635 [Microgenomates group bacterium RIFCSPLOWO2_01_FULL_47_10]|nr:MAG: hypothetical protein A3B57_00635 [Microgenomates group bacterium RIFCSPLOWO2_01_FULL_47_10]
MSSLSEWARENAAPLAVGGVGVVLIGVGIWQSVAFRMEQDGQVEIITTSSPSPSPLVQTLVVDVGGAVEKPGVYQMAEGSRVNDVLMKAGGLSADADRAYVSRSINLADRLHDGSKVYIPTKDDPNQVSEVWSRAPAGENSNSNTIHINSATISELDALWGVGQARAQQIVENRPYNTVQELVTRAKMPQSIIDHNAGILQL